jgi:hypothetical protein
MKKFAAKAVVLAIGAACGGSVFAGSFTTPASDAAATPYAAEALTAATKITIATAVYTMGVGRATGQNFTVIVNPSNATFDSANSCTGSTLVGGGNAAAVAVSLKRAAPTECAWDVTVPGAFNAGGTLSLNNLVLATHSLNTAGGSASYILSLKDPGETSFIDNVATVTRRVATSVQTVNVYAATSDTATVADVAAPGGPLTGFLPEAGPPADTNTVAAANLTFVNNPNNNAFAADGTTIFNFANTTGTATVVLTGPTSGVATGKFCLDIDGDGNYCETGETMNVTPTSGTITVPAANFPAPGVTITKAASFQADGNTNLGTARTFALSGTITPQVGSPAALADTAGKNATAWVWSANASQLMTAYFNTNTAKFLTRFFLLNTGAAAVTYSATCYSETGNAITYQPGRNGSLIANGLTTVAAENVCTFAGNTRGSVIFTVNAPVSQIKGTYQFIDPVTLNGAVLPMVRPYNAANTTE